MSDTYMNVSIFLFVNDLAYMYYCSDIVSMERPDLEEQRTNLITKINSNKKELKVIEDSVLKQMSEVKGNILETGDIIIAMKESLVSCLLCCFNCIVITAFWEG